MTLAGADPKTAPASGLFAEKLIVPGVTEAEPSVAVAAVSRGVPGGPACSIGTQVTWAPHASTVVMRHTLPRIAN